MTSDEMARSDMEAVSRASGRTAQGRTRNHPRRMAVEASGVISLIALVLLLESEPYLHLQRLGEAHTVYAGHKDRDLGWSNEAELDMLCQWLTVDVAEGVKAGQFERWKEDEGRS